MVTPPGRDGGPRGGRARPRSRAASSWTPPAGCWSARERCCSLVLAVRDVVGRPRLTAGPDGVDVRTWRRGRHLPWAGLRVRVRESRRLGVRSRTLELDTAAGPDDDGVLVVLGRRDLGADPTEVARALHAPRPDVVLEAVDDQRGSGEGHDEQEDGEQRRAQRSALAAGGGSPPGSRWQRRPRRVRRGARAGRRPGRKLMTTLMASRVSSPRRSCRRTIISTPREPEQAVDRRGCAGHRLQRVAEQLDRRRHRRARTAGRRARNRHRPS